MTATTGKAIQRYLKAARPACARKELFLRLHAPFRRLSNGALYHLTSSLALLRSGVDINTIRIWLGHVSLPTTHIYAESDLKMKAGALARCEAPLVQGSKRRSDEKGLMSFLRMV